MTHANTHRSSETDVTRRSTETLHVWRERVKAGLTRQQRWRITTARHGGIVPDGLGVWHRLHESRRAKLRLLQLQHPRRRSTRTTMPQPANADRRPTTDESQHTTRPYDTMTRRHGEAQRTTQRGTDTSHATTSGSVHTVMAHVCAHVGVVGGRVHGACQGEEHRGMRMIHGEAAGLGGGYCPQTHPFDITARATSRAHSHAQHAR